MSQLATFIPTTAQMDQNVSDQQTTALYTSSYIADMMEDPVIGMTISTDVYAVLLGVSLIAVVVMILLIMIVVLRFMAHQKGTYYTREETLAFKTDPEVQEVIEDLEDPDDPEEEEP